MDITSLSIDDAIIHEITKKRLAPPGPPELVLSHAVSSLDADLRGYFQDRIVESLRLAAFAVVVDSNVDSPTPTLIHEQLTDAAADFVEISRAVAQHLFDAQQSVQSSPGLLVIVRGTVNTGKCLGILKLQKHEGIRLERTGASGAETYSIEHLRQLMLTNETRVFKVGLFEGRDVIDVSDVAGVVSDKQQFSRPEKQVADFFLRDFLGCRVRDNPAQTTSRYFVRAEKYINDEVADPEKRTRYHRALLADLSAQGNAIAPRQFAEQHLEEPDRQAFISFLKADAVATAQFTKDTELIETRIREEEYVLASGIRVRGSVDALDEHANVTQQDDETLEMLIVDRLKSVKGAARR